MVPHVCGSNRTISCARICGILMVMSDFNHPTQTLINLITNFLTNLGHTNIQSTERWEGDGVYHVWSDQSTKEVCNERVYKDKWADIRYGWTLDVSGNDNSCFDAGISFSYSPKNHNEEEYIVIESWDHLKQVIATH